MQFDSQVMHTAFLVIGGIGFVAAVAAPVTGRDDVAIVGAVLMFVGMIGTGVWG